MILRKITKNAIIAGVGLFVTAGGAGLPTAKCGVDMCCTMPLTGGDLAIHQMPCGCCCGQFEESQVPDQNAVISATAEINPIPTKFDYIIESENNVVGDLIPRFIERQEFSHSPPLIPDNKYTPLLC